MMEAALTLGLEGHQVRGRRGGEEGILRGRGPASEDSKTRLGTCLGGERAGSRRPGPAGPAGPGLLCEQRGTAIASCPSGRRELPVSLSLCVRCPGPEPGARGPPTFPSGANSWPGSRSRARVLELHVLAAWGLASAAQTRGLGYQSGPSARVRPGHERARTGTGRPLRRNSRRPPLLGLAIPRRSMTKPPGQRGARLRPTVLGSPEQ